MDPLLTVASNEWDSSRPKVQVSTGNRLQLYVCPEPPGHPHTDLIQ